MDEKLDLMMEASALPIGKEQLKKFMQVLRAYDAGLRATKSRIMASENWWKLRNAMEEEKEGIGQEEGFRSRSGWLHNVIVSKHADAMEAFPEPSILPREAGDRREARMLSAIIPCVLEQNGYEKTYSDTIWQKLKSGTGVNKVVWDPDKLNGLGDVCISRVNLLNLYWQPGVGDIQDSRYVFHTELQDRDVLEETYPQLRGRLKGQSFLSAKFLYDDQVDVSDKATVIEVYYHKLVEGRRTLQYCKFVGEEVLFATENDPDMMARGLYDHGMYPYVLDTLFPIEGSPCGYGFVDICRNPQTAIDLLNTSFIKNARMGAVPRFFARMDGNVNEEEFLDFRKPIVHVSGNVDETSLRQISFSPLDSVYVNVLDRTINELRETSGNTQTSAGNVTSGVTAASAIAALQEASGKGSRDSTLATYRAFAGIVNMVIELVRQFYDLPRKFRILGQLGGYEYISYSNEGLLPRNQEQYGVDLGYRMPVFDIKVSAQKKNAYTRVSQNELAMQLYKMGFFDPAQADMALQCLEMMEFEGRDILMQRIAMGAKEQRVQAQRRKLAEASVRMPAADPLTGLKRKEHARVEKARAQAANAPQPGGRIPE